MSSQTTTPDAMTLSYLLSWQLVAGTVLAISPLTSYLDTVLSIRRRKSSAGFSLDICAIMLVSSICKVYFYFGRPYEMSLFVQSWIMIAVQVWLLKLALQFRPRQWANGPLDRDPSLSESEQSYEMTPERLLLGKSIVEGSTTVSPRRPYAFWQWDQEAPYWTFLTRFSVYLGILQLILGSWSVYVEGLGLVGLLIEAVLPLPQIITIAARGSVDGFRPSLLVSWLGGDISKLAFLLNSDKVAPQFLICTIIQGVLDAFIGLQYYMYTTGRWKQPAAAQVVVRRQRAQSLKLQGIEPK